MIIEFGLIQNFILAIAVVSSFVAVAFLLKSLFHKKPQVKPEVKPTDAQYSKVIKTANRQAKSILEHTSETAAGLLTNASQTNEHLKEDLDRVLQSVAAKDIHDLKITTEQYKKDYEQQLKNIQEQLNQTTQDVIRNTQKTYNDRLETFTKELLKSGLATQIVVDKKTSELVSTVEAEIDEYKKTQLKKVDEQVKILLEKVFRDVLRTSIPQNTHQDLIIKSLEDAKKDGMFKL